jgi:hypothetical protein
MFSYSGHCGHCWYHERRSFRDGMAALLVLALVVFGLLHARDLTGRHHHVHHRPAHSAQARTGRHHHGRTPPHSH